MLFRSNTTVIVVDFTTTDAPITEPTPTIPMTVPSESKKPSKWLAVAALGSWLVSAAIVVTVVVSAITSG